MNVKGSRRRIVAREMVDVGTRVKAEVAGEDNEVAGRNVTDGAINLETETSKGGAHKVETLEVRKGMLPDAAKMADHRTTGTMMDAMSIHLRIRV